MKNQTIGVIFMMLLVVSLASLPAWAQELGVFGAWRSVANEEIQEFYGKGGLVYFPYLAIAISPKLSLGVGYEGGYNKTAQLGVFKESATLSVQGFEVFCDYYFATDTIAPYLHFGVGFYTFKQDVDSPYAASVEDKQVAMTVGTGIKFYLTGGFFAGVEIKYIPLEVQPESEAVNLGGIRAGIKLGFDFKRR